METSYFRFSVKTRFFFFFQCNGTIIGANGSSSHSSSNSEPNGSEENFRENNDFPSLTCLRDNLPIDEPFKDKFPNDFKLAELMKRTGYNVAQRNGQRIYGGPPPNWNSPPPCKGTEVFVGKVPRDMFEWELVPLFETVSK